MLISTTTTIRLEFKPQDLWIGAYWERKRNVVIVEGTSADGKHTNLARGVNALHIWICLLPMLPIHITRPMR